MLSEPGKPYMLWAQEALPSDPLQKYLADPWTILY